MAKFVFDETISLYDLLRFARAYSDLGDAVTGQLDDLLDHNTDDPNPNAVRLIQRELAEFHPDIAAACAEYAEDNPDAEE